MLHTWCWLLGYFWGMEFLALGQLSEYTKQQCVENLIENYAGEDSGFDYGEIKEIDKLKAIELLKDKDLILAYEHVGDYGCDSSSFHIFKSLTNDDYFELHGGHCSCFGFEGQLKDIEKTTLIALKDRASKNTLLYLGGYDGETKTSIANKFILDK